MYGILSGLKPCPTEPAPFIEPHSSSGCPAACPKLSFWLMGAPFSSCGDRTLGEWSCLERGAWLLCARMQALLPQGWFAWCALVSTVQVCGLPPFPQKEAERMGHPG